MADPPTTANANPGNILDDDGEKNVQDDDIPHELTIENFDDGDDEISSDDEQNNGPILATWARVFYQGRDDRLSRQILPSLSPTFTSVKDSYLYIVVDAVKKGMILQVYPDDSGKHKPIVDPIELKYFYAAIVPNTHSIAALFLREDLRPQRRYIFRVEFRNENVQRPSHLAYELQKGSKAAKYSQSSKFYKTFKKYGLEIIFPKDDVEYKKRLEKSRIQKVHKFYMATLKEALKDVGSMAERFVAIVNIGVDEKKQPHALWYSEEHKYESDAESDDFSEDLSSSDDERYGDEKVEDTFERVLLDKRSSKE